MSEETRTPDSFKGMVAESLGKLIKMMLPNSRTELGPDFELIVYTKQLEEEHFIALSEAAKGDTRMTTSIRAHSADELAVVFTIKK